MDTGVNTRSWEYLTKGEGNMKLNTEGVDIVDFINLLINNTAIYSLSAERNEGFISGNTCIVRNLLKRAKKKGDNNDA